MGYTQEYERRWEGEAGGGEGMRAGKGGSRKERTAGQRPCVRGLGQRNRCGLDTRHPKMGHKNLLTPPSPQGARPTANLGKNPANASAKPAENRMPQTLKSR